MYIQTDRDNLQALKLPEMDSIAEFSDNNIAQVSSDDGEILVSEIDHISEHEPN